MLLSFWRKLSGRRTPARTTRKVAGPRRPQLEALEHREVPSATLTNGVLAIHGNNNANVTTVQFNNNNTPLNAYDDKVVVKTTTGAQTETKSFNYWLNLKAINGQTVHLHAIQSMTYHGLGG